MTKVELTPENLWIDPPEGWRYGFPKKLPPEHRARATEWMIEQGYPRKLTEGSHFYCRMWNDSDE